MVGAGMAHPLMVFTAVLNQAFMMLEFNRQNCVCSSSGLIFTSSISQFAVHLVLLRLQPCTLQLHMLHLPRRPLHSAAGNAHLQPLLNRPTSCH